MRVLYICHRIPYPPNKGEKIRAFHQLRGIASAHEVDLFTLADQPEDLAHRTALLRYCREVTVVPLNPRLARLRSLPYLFTKTPLTIPCFHSAELHRAVRKALAERSYDRIFVSCSAMAQYVEEAGQTPVLMDFVDVDSDKWTQFAGFVGFPLSAVYRREGRCLREYERQACRRSTCVLVTTEREGVLARGIAEGTPVHVLPNGVDSDYFTLPASSGAGEFTSAPVVVFTGDMSYFPNEEAAIHFARRVLPLVQRSQPDARFLVVGRNPSRKVRDLTGIAGVEVTGFVPDVRVHLARARLSVAPFSIAAGVPNKILEAMSVGLPVVATPRAVQGLSPGVAGAIDTVEGAEEMAARVLALLRDPKEARRKGMECRRRVLEEHNWGRVIDRLLELLDNPTSTARTGACAPARREPSLGGQIAQDLDI